MAAAPKVFVRDATGLTREASGLDVFVYNTLNQNVGIGALFVLGFLGLYSGVSPYLAIALTVAATIPVAAVYGMLSSAMPRSGGDYVFVSRILTPGLGFFTSFNWLFWLLVYIGVPAGFLPQYGVAPLLRVLAVVTGSRGVLQLAGSVESPVGIIVVGTVLMAVFTYVFVRGVRLYMRIQNIAFLLAMVNALLMIAVLFSTPHAAFVSRFDRYVVAAGGKAGAYAAIMHAYGTHAAGFSLGNTLLFSSWVILIIAFSVTSTMIGGEVKSARRSQFYGMTTPIVFTGIVMALLAAAVFHTAGLRFVEASGSVAPSTYGLGFVPYYQELAAIAAGPGWLGVVMMVLFLFWTYVWLPVNFLASTRILLAWSIDRLIPDRVADVHPRLHAPTVAIAIVAVLGEVSLILYAVGILSLLSGIFTWLLSFMIAAVAALVFPYRRPELYRGSPFQGRLLGVPVITWVGAVALVALVYMEAILWLDPVQGLGANNPTSAIMRWVSGALIVAAVVAYQVIKAARRRSGIDVTAAFVEIPPE
ncbi:MAG: APC family permease [Firmicutes bacterium]|nr:APC family permease [Bacillota bacterium]